MSDTVEQMDTEGIALSPAQRLVLTARDGRETPVIQGATLNGPFNERRFADAFSAVCGRHEITQTALRKVSGYTQPRQFPYALSVPPLEMIACTADTLVKAEGEALTGIAPELEALALCRAGTHPLRAVLLRGGPELGRVVLVASRAAADRASLVALLRATFETYASQATSQAEEEPVQYSQFAEWREELSRDEDADEAAKYWSGYNDKVAAQAKTQVDLPFRIRARGESVAARNAVTLSTEFDAATQNALYDVFTRSHDLPADVIAQAAWWVVQARIGGANGWLGNWQHDCRRDYEMLRDGIGAYEQSLPVVLHCGPQDRFLDVARALHATLSAHRRWQEYAPSTLVRSEIGNRAPFIHVDANESLLFEDVDTRMLSMEIDASNALSPDCELGLQVDISADGKIRRIALQYAEGVYAREAMSVLLNQYVCVLSGLAARSAQKRDRIADLPLNDEKSERTLLDWRGVSMDMGNQPGLIEQIATHAQRTPNEPALVAGTLALTYGDLHARVTRLASQLTTLGARPDAPVALAMPRGAAQVITLLATMQAGAPYLPIDPAWPAARRRAILAQAKPSFVICTRDDYTSLSDEDRRSVHYKALDTVSFELVSSPSQAVTTQRLPQPSDAAYVLFTSGSTGQPKGVVIEHRQLLNYVAGVSATLGLERVRRVALTSTVAADLGNTALFGAFYNGACLVIADDDDTHDAAAFKRFLREHAIDCLKITPSHLDALLDTADSPDTIVPRTLILGGEPVPVRLAARIRAIDPACRIFNHYGPTETTVGVLVHEAVTSDDDAQGDYLPLTTPLPNCHVYVLDHAMRLAPVGVLGEVYIGGAQVCRGYLDAPPAMNAANAFVDDPFRPGERLYRSGDVARYLPGGGIQIAGRADDQIKIRGFRIEPAEIEAALLALEGIGQAAVRAFGEDTHRYLVAFVTREHADMTEAAIRAALAERLPAPMVPARIVVMAALPRLANGKIDRRALLEPERAVDASGGMKRDSEPRTALEKLLAQTLAVLLERDSVGLHDSLFELGGDSLIVIRLASRVRDLLRIEVLPGLIFEHPSVADLARTLTAQQGTPGLLERTAALRLKLDAMDPAERAKLEERARERATTGETR